MKAKIALVLSLVMAGFAVGCGDDITNITNPTKTIVIKKIVKVPEPVAEEPVPAPETPVPPVEEPPVVDPVPQPTPQPEPTPDEDDCNKNKGSERGKGKKKGHCN